MRQRPRILVDIDPDGARRDRAPAGFPRTVNGERSCSVPPLTGISAWRLERARRDTYALPMGHYEGDREGVPSV
ncbi:MAG TPA: hypothetical protein VK908_09645 [Jiangellales bacterium]|nr:hypothetical protein [Jiangellales bacterium]